MAVRSWTISQGGIEPDQEQRQEFLERFNNLYECNQSIIREEQEIMKQMMAINRILNCWNLKRQRNNMSIEDFKQYMLELSDKGIILDDNDWDYEQWQLWKACYDIVHKDGYVEEDVECIGMIEPKLTPKGKLFLLEGGYVGKSRKEVTSKITQWSKDVLKDTLSMFISNGITDALKL